MWKAVLREPLVHFVVLGSLLFAADRLRGHDAPAPPPPAPLATPTPTTGPIVVDVARETAVAQRRLGRAPTPAEVEAEIQRFVDEEILFREAIARGLERDDPMIHERIASRMSYVLAEGAVVPEPTDAQLHAWFDAHRAEYATPERIDFTHVFIRGDDTTRAEQLAHQLGAGASPDTLGDTFSGGRKYRGRKLADLAEAFGPEFVDKLATQAPDIWVLRRSRHGLHLVRVDRVEAPKGADFEAARLETRRAWQDDQRRIASEAALKLLRAHWQVERK